MRQHLIVQAEAAGHEALGLGVIDAVHEPHELRHDVAVIPGRPERVFRHGPALGEDHEVDIGGAAAFPMATSSPCRSTGRDDRTAPSRPARSAAGRICRDSSCRARRSRRSANAAACDAEQFAAPFDDQRVRRIDILVGRHRRKEVARVGEAIGADRPAVRQRERAAVILADIAARQPAMGSARKITPRGMMQISPGSISITPNSVTKRSPPLLRHDQHLAVGVEEVLVLHRAR